jgi:hypothetical protein
MWTSVPLALPSNKGLLNRSRCIAGAKAHSGRSPPSPAWFEVEEPTGATAPLAAAEPERLFAWPRCVRTFMRTRLLTVELSGAHADV